MRLISSSAAAGDGLDACSEPNKQEKDGSVESKMGQAQELTTGERLAVGDAVFDAKDSAAVRDAGTRGRLAERGRQCGNAAAVPTAAAAAAARGRGRGAGAGGD